MSISDLSAVKFKPSADEIVKFSRARERAKMQVMFNKYQKLFNLQFTLGEMGVDCFGRPLTQLRDDIHVLSQKVKDLSKTTDNCQFYWITVSINPKWVKERVTHYIDDPEDYCPDCIAQMLNNDLIEQAKHFASCKMWTDYVFVWEQRTQLSWDGDYDASDNAIKQPETDYDFFYKGQHLHFILARRSSYCHSQIVNGTKRMWEKYARVSDSRIVNIHRLPEKFVNEKLDYILGDKWDIKEKPKKVQADEFLREVYQILPHYTNFSDNSILKSYWDKKLSPSNI